MVKHWFEQFRNLKTLVKKRILLTGGHYIILPTGFLLLDSSQTGFLPHGIPPTQDSSHGIRPTQDSSSTDSSHTILPNRTSFRLNVLHIGFLQYKICPKRW